VESDQLGAAGLDRTISVLDGGVKNAATNVALNEIDGWRMKLEASGVPELEPIADGLARLHDELTKDPMDAAAVGNLLADLGGQVRSVASGGMAQGVADRLEKLAGLLSTEGRRLSGSD
jgi:hypothetical protein